jgi:transposase
VGTKLSNEAKRATRKGRPNHPIEFKRRLAQLSCEGDVSVSRLAQEHGVNANRLFKWRRHYLAGMFDESAVTAALLPVSIKKEPVERDQVKVRPPVSGPLAGVDVEIAFADCTLRIGRTVDMTMLGAILALLRQ